MSQAREVRYTARSITPPADRNGTSSSPPPKRRSPSRSPPPKSASRSPRPRSPKRRSTSRSPPRRRGRSRSRDRSRSRSPDDRNPGNNLYVTGLSTRVTEEDLQKFFSKEGKVKNCHVVLDPRTKESRGFAFVTMDTLEDARRCIKYLHRTVLEGRLVTVEKMSQAREVRYTARSITPPADRNGTSSSPPPKRRSPSRSPPPKSASRSPRPRSPKRRSTSRSPPRRRGRSRSRDRSRSRSPDDRNPGNNLYVTGLSTRVTEEDLQKFFSKEGKVKNCHVVLDPRTKESRGFAFVTMDTLEDARRCIKYLHRTVLEGRLVTVEKAKRTRERTPTPGKYCGRRGGSQRSPSPYRARRRERSRSRERRRERSRSRDRRERSRSRERRRERSRSRDRRERSRSRDRRRERSRSRDRRRERSRSRDRRGSSPHDRRHGERSRSPTSNGNHKAD